MKTKEQTLKEEIEKIRGCGKELDNDKWCGKDFWVCNNCGFKLNRIVGYTQAKKEVIEEVMKIIDKTQNKETARSKDSIYWKLDELKQKLEKLK